MIGWAIQTMIATSLLILLVLLIRRPFARLFGARAAYALWLVPAFRMVLPPIPESAASIAPTAVGGANYILTSQSAASQVAPDFAALAILAWAGGAVAFLIVHCVRHRLFVAGALEEARRLDAPACPYPVLASRAVDGPMTTGLFHPLIIVPEDFELRLNPEQQRLALLHEELHHRRGDLWASCIALLFGAVHWFNPIVHYAWRALRRDMEAACDAQLLQQTGHSSAAAYADTIVRCTSGPVPRSLCALTSLDELKRRLTMLKINEGPGRRALGFAAAGIVAVATATTAIAGPEKTTKEVHEIKKVEIRHGDGAKHGGKGAMHHKMQCAGEKFEAASESGSGDNVEKFKLVLCADKGESLLPALEKAAADLEQRDDMPAERKADMLAKIRAKIAELRSAS